MPEYKRQMGVALALVVITVALVGIVLLTMSTGSVTTAAPSQTAQPYVMSCYGCVTVTTTTSGSWVETVIVTETLTSVASHATTTYNLPSSCPIIYTGAVATTTTTVGTGSPISTVTATLTRTSTSYTQTETVTTCGSTSTATTLATP